MRGECLRRHGDGDYHPNGVPCAIHELVACDESRQICNSIQGEIPSFLALIDAIHGHDKVCVNDEMIYAVTHFLKSNSDSQTTQCAISRYLSPQHNAVCDGGGGGDGLDRMRILARELNDRTRDDGAICGHCGSVPSGIRFRHPAYDVIPVHDSSASQGGEVAVRALVKQNSPRHRGYDAEWGEHASWDRMSDETRGHGAGRFACSTREGTHQNRKCNQY